MKLLIKISELDNYKSRDKIPLECYVCKKIFYKPKNEILDYLKNPKTFRKLKFCSHFCKGELQYSQVSSICMQCKKSIEIVLSEFKKSKNHFCSQTCAAIYNNAHKTKGTRISKLEKWLQIRLPIIYPNLDIHFNRKDAINSELDIYIPSLKLAFELNGIFHYEPIYGKDKLDKTQLNDQNKFELCIKNNINLCLIDVSSQKYFKEKTSQKYLNIILDIINGVLREN